MYVLGIETSCDETSVAIVKDGKEILSNTIATQEDLHAIYGGVFPELASRRHVEVIPHLVDKALIEAELSPREINLLAVTQGPGLVGSLAVGINTAKALALAWDIPLIGVNHVKAHIYVAMMHLDKEPIFPSLGVVLSGGHTCIFLLKSLTEYELVSTTVDDAIGEAFDKIAKLLDLSYPGGPEIEKLARKGDPSAYSFRAGCVKSNPLYFSFSGLKTNVLYAIKGQNGDKKAITPLIEAQKQDIAASFQKCAIMDVIEKIERAALMYGCREVYLGGGVTQNQYLREKLAEKSSLSPHWPNQGLCLDNAAMIAGLGYQMYQEKFETDTLSLKVYPRIAFN